MSTDSERVLGLKMSPLPEGCTPLSAYLFLKVLDEDGDVTWITKEAGESLSDEEVLGALSGFTDFKKEDLASNWVWGDGNGDQKQGE